MDSNDDFLLFAWEKQCSYDPDATDGVIYKYRSSTQQFFYSLTHTFEAGSGKPVIGMYKLTTLDRLLGDYRANPGKWNEESWKRMCDDFRQHPEKAPGSFIRLKELHFEREKLKGRTLNDGRSIIQFIAADCASSISFDSPEKLKLKAEDFYYYREGENSGYVFISLKHVDSGRNFVTWEWCGEPRSDGHPERADRFYETDTDELEFMIRIGSHTKDVRHPLMLKKGIIDPTQVKLTNTCPICRKIKFSDDLMCNKCWREADSQVVKFEKELEQIKSKRIYLAYTQMMGASNFHSFFHCRYEGQNEYSSSDSRYGINTVLGIPLRYSYNYPSPFNNGSGTSVSQRVISFNELIAVAYEWSEKSLIPKKDYDKLKDINESNWMDKVLAEL